MRLLLDTHILLWATLRTARLSVEARALISEEGHELVFSTVSLWEIAIKRRLDRPDFQVDPHVLRRALVDAGYSDLPVTTDHALATMALPPIHKDPFDRIMIAQATVEGYLLLTSDAVVARYPGPIRSI